MRWNQRRHLQHLSSIALACCVSLTTVAATAQDSGPTELQEESALRRYYAANGMLNRDLHEMALEEYDAFLTVLPDHAKAGTARYGAGVCHFRLQQFAQAIDMLESIDLEQNNRYAAEIHTMCGQSHLQLGQHEQAARRFQNVLQQHASHAMADDAATMLAESLFHMRDYKAAALAASTVARQWSDSPLRDRAELFHGLSQMALGEHKDAARRFELLMTRSPDGPYAARAELLQAQSLHRDRQLPAALKIYQRIFKRDATIQHPDAMYGIAAVLYEQDKFKEAAEVLDVLLKDQPAFHDRAKSVLLHAQIAIAMNDIASAREGLLQLEKKKDTNSDIVQYWLAKCDFRDARHDLAAARLERTINAFPKSTLRAEMYYDRAVALSNGDDDDVTIEALDAFLNTSPKHALAADALHLKATVQYRNGAYQDCLESCAVYMQQFAGHQQRGAVLFLAGESAFMSDDLQRCIASYQQFLAEYPRAEEAPSAMHRLGMALYQIERFDDALAMLKAATTQQGETPSHFASSLLALGDLHLLNHEYAQAAASFERYLNIASDTTESADVLLKLGIAIDRQGDPKSAMTIYQRVIDEFPDSTHVVQAWFEHGQAALARDLFDVAFESFEHVIAFEDDNRFRMHALNHIGSLALKAGDAERAAEAFALCATSTTEGGDAGEARFNQAQALMQINDDVAALQAFEQLLREHPRHNRAPLAAVDRCICLARLGQHQQAIAAMNDLPAAHLASVPDSVQATFLYERAWCHRALENNAAAAQVYTRMIEQCPNATLIPHVRLELADLVAADDDHAQAVSLLTPLIESESTAPALKRQALYRAAVARFELGNNDVAADLLETMLLDDTTDSLASDARLLCAEAHYRRHAHGRVVAHLEQFLNESPDHNQMPIALLRLGESQAALQSWVKSQKTFERFLREHETHDHWYQARFGIGWAMENQGQHEDAMKAYREIVDRHDGPSAARAQFQIGECLYALERHDEAVRELLKVDILYAYPQWSAAALYEAGRCFRELNNPVEARRQFDQVVARFEDSEWAALSTKQLDELKRAGIPGRD